MIKTDFVTDFRNMFLAYYKDNLMTLTEAFLVYVLLLELGKSLFSGVFSKNNFSKLTRILEKKYGAVSSWKNRCLFVCSKSWNIAKRESSKRYCSLTAAVPRCLWKGLLKNLLKLVGEHLYQALCFMKFQASTRQLIWKRNPETDVFL